MALRHPITMLGTGLIAQEYTEALHAQRGCDRVTVVYSRTEESAQAFAAKWGVPHWTTDLSEAVSHEATNTIVIALPNDMHGPAIHEGIASGKPLLCTKPLARTAAEAKQLADAAQKAGVFAGYLEDLCYTPKTLEALRAVKAGAIGDVMWVRSRAAHSGPSGAWFHDAERAGGGALIDLGCHCVEVIRSFVGKAIRPTEAVCWADTRVHPIAAEDNAVALIRFENRALGQLEASWTLRGGTDLRDEVVGTEGTIWLNHFLRTGFDMYSPGTWPLAGEADATGGWQFPVGDTLSALGHRDMFTDMFNAIDTGTVPNETFVDGYVVMAILDACYRSIRSKRWEPIDISSWPDSPA